MATKDLTTATFEEAASREGITLVDFWAEWCGPCKRFAPTYEKVSENHPDIIFGKVDTDAEPALMQEFQIMSIPTLMAIRDGIIVFAEPGARGEQFLESLISQVRALDMDDVRGKLKAA
jgi:thioredoxin 1